MDHRCACLRGKAVSPRMQIEATKRQIEPLQAECVEKLLSAPLSLTSLSQRHGATYAQR